MKKSFRQRLAALAAAKNEAARQSAQEEMDAQLTRLPRMRVINADGRLEKILDRFVRNLHNADRDRELLHTAENPNALRADLIELLQFRARIEYDRWEPVDKPDKKLADEANLKHCWHGSVTAASAGDFRLFQERMDDILLMFGKLARNMKSVFLSRIITMTSDLSGRLYWHDRCTSEKATQLVDEFLECWELLATEVRLLDDDELLRVWPEIPQHEAKDVVFFDSDSMGAEEATEESRHQAWEIYCKSLKNKGLLPAAKDERHPMTRTLEEATRLADEVRNRKPSTDDRWKTFNYDRLCRILETDMDFCYDGYADEDPDGNPIDREQFSWDEPTEESMLRDKIIDVFGRYLTAACALAKEIASRSYEDLSVCQTVWVSNGGNFFTYAPHLKTQKRRDLKELIAKLKRARPVLWADCKNYKPKLSDTQTAVNALKAHVTSETDRGIAAKAPKRVRKFGHEGNGLKGPKTRTMKEQKRAFDAFLKEHPEGPGHSRISRAHECWLKHPEWIKAAKATGEAKGYANHKSLAAAK